jgi:two-component system, NarL family, response regulator LiaR
MTTSNPIRIIVVDDHRVVHQALAEMISFIDDFELVAQGSNGHEAVELCRQFVPDVVLMDVVMPVMDGIEATRRIHGEHAVIKIIALSSFQDDVSVNAMLKSGAVGYILKNASVAELEGIIRTVNEGNAVIDCNLMRKVLAPGAMLGDSDFRLSPRELEILRMIASGMNYTQVSKCLTISISTVKFHIGNMLSKLHVETRNEAIMVASKSGLL